MNRSVLLPVIVAAFIGSIVLLVVLDLSGLLTLQPTDGINLASAYFLAILVVFGLLEILRQPQIRFEKTMEPVIVELVQPNATSFKIRILSVGIANQKGRLGKTAENIDVALIIHQASPMPPLRLPLQFDPNVKIDLPYQINPASADAVMKALSTSIFSKRVLPSLNQGIGAVFIIGFSMETNGQFYFAGEIPVQMALPLQVEKHASISFSHLIASGSNFSVVESMGLMIMGWSWDTVQATFYNVPQTRRLSDEEARKSAEFLRKQDEVRRPSV